MTFRVSPGVDVFEIDNTNSIPAVSTATGAYVGNFRWGPVNEVTTVTDEVDLVRKFSSPDTANAVSFLTAAHFLKYSNDLRVVREIDSSAVNANAGGDASTVVKNATNHAGQTFAFADQGLWIARYPGTLGNSLKVSMFGFKTDTSTTLSNFTSWTYSSNFDGPVGTSTYASNLGSSNDEVHIAVIDEDGLFTGIAGTVLEVFPFLSQASDAKAADGSSIYYKDYINNNSKYVWFADHDSTNTANAGTAATTAADYAVTPANGQVNVSLTAGVNSGALGATEFATGWDLFEDAATIDVSLLIAPDLPSATATTIANDIISIAAARKDAVAFISPVSDDDTAAEIKTFADALTASSYAFVDSGRLKVYDKYNDGYVNIPACSAVAGLVADTDRTRGPWFSPAGFQRGQIFGVTQLYYNPSETDRNTLYKAGVNPIVSFPGRGTLLYGDKTHLNRPSAFDRINVRRLFITLEKSIAVSAENLLFEQNDVFTRARFITDVEPFLRNIKGRRGLEDFRVVCDTTNNTSQVITANEFVGDIYIKPPYSINFVTLNFVATRNGVDFNEIAGGQ